MVSRVPGIDSVRELRIRWIGHTLRVEIDPAVEPSLTLVEPYDLAHRTERPTRRSRLTRPPPTPIRAIASSRWHCPRRSWSPRWSVDAISTGSDPHFTDVTTLADVYHFGTQHFDHHLAQLTVGDD